VDLGRLVDQLVHDDGQEIAEHDVDDRPQTGHGGADAEAGEAGFRDRRVDDAILAELFDQSGEHLERRPASATSSPIRTTSGSRRISSAMAP
jgi:hypothetical protein